MSQVGFYFDMGKCAGCKTCLVACKDKNDLETGVSPRKVDTYQIGSYPSVSLYHFSHACNHCADPQCVRNCPTGAMQKDADGTVFNDHDRCIGCGACALACPYGAPTVDDRTRVSQKCDGCREIRKGEGTPVCVAACPFRALDFGEVSELEKKYQGMNLVRHIPVHKDFGTSSNTIIAPKRNAESEMGKEIVL